MERFAFGEHSLIAQPDESNLKPKTNMTTTHSIAQHTPGPWRIFQNRDGEETQLGVYDSEGYKLASIEAWKASAKEEGKANAALIASAPELLAALKAWEKWAQHYRSSSVAMPIGPVSTAAQAAIAKAEGRS